MTFVPFRVPAPTIYPGFQPAARRLLPCRIIEDRSLFDEARNWCHENCPKTSRLSISPNGLGPVFEFEHESDAFLFALTFPDSI